MNKFHSLLITLSVLGAFGIAEAGRCNKARCNKSKPVCEKREKCVQPEASACPQNEVTEECSYVDEPCRKMICVEGTCPHKIVKRCTTTYSKRCDGPCRVSCEAAVSPENRGGDVATDTLTN